MPAYTKVNGEWKEVVPDTMVDGVWRTVDAGYVKVDGEWKLFYQKP